MTRGPESVNYLIALYLREKRSINTNIIKNKSIPLCSCMLIQYVLNCRNYKKSVCVSFSNRSLFSHSITIRKHVDLQCECSIVLFKFRSVTS